MWTQVAANGGEVPKPYITTDEYEKSMSRKTSVKEFSEAMHKANAEKKSYEELQEEMATKARNLGITKVY